MTLQDKKNAVLKWLSLSGYPRTHQSFNFIASRLKKKYPKLNYAAWEIDLQNILTELESENLIGKEEHNQLAFNNDGQKTAKIEHHYFANLDGDAFVQRLPEIDKEINNDAVMEILHLLLRYMPPYGPFEESSFKQYAIPKSANDIFLLLVNDNGLMAKLSLYLVDNGFAEWRNDIQYGKAFYIQLTDRGRNLKECGNIFEYFNREKSAQDSKRHQKKRDIYLFWVVVFGAMGTCISALNDGAQFLDFSKEHTPNWLLVSYFSSGLVAGLLIWLLVALLRKSIGKSKRQA